MQFSVAFTHHTGYTAHCHTPAGWNLMMELFAPGVERRPLAILYSRGLDLLFLTAQKLDLKQVCRLYHALTCNVDWLHAGISIWALSIAMSSISSTMAFSTFLVNYVIELSQLNNFVIPKGPTVNFVFITQDSEQNQLNNDFMLRSLMKNWRLAHSTRGAMRHLR